MAQPTVVVDIALLGKMAGYIEMLVKDPHSTVFASLSDIYRTFSLYDEAVAVAEKGTEMLPSYAPGFVALGRALAEKGAPARASDAYRQALSLDPLNLPALTGLASSCLGCGEAEESLELLNRAQSIDPDDEVVKQLLPVVKKLAVFSPPSTQPTSQIAPHATSQDISLQSLEVSGETEGEPSKPSEIIAAPLPPIATATLADIYIQQGYYERALKVFSDLLAGDPGNLEIRRRHDDLLGQIAGVASEKIEAAQSVSSCDIKPLERVVESPQGDGKDALVAMYGRWLDAINRRRADVH